MSLTVLLIGGETLTRACGEALLARGHQIAAVLSDAVEIADWARGQGVRALPLTARSADDLPQVDWLLSVANLQILPQAILAKARLGAVNFHDGPLPGHAGLNAPVWALLAGEAEHAITWHLIEGGVDQGRVLEERRFDITAGETALTLNTRCFEAGLESFAAVLAQLEQGLELKDQPKIPGQMHYRADRPAAQGRIDPKASAAEILRLVNALDHGSYWNPLCTAKIAMAGRVINIGSARLADGQGEPGRILRKEALGLVMACGDGAVLLSRLSCQDQGLPLDPRQIVGDQIDLLEPTAAADLSAALKPVAAKEPVLRAALQRLSPLTLPVSSGADAAPDWQNIALSQDFISLVLALPLALGQGSGDVARAVPGVPGYLAHWTPLHLDAAGDLALAREGLALALAEDGLPWPLDLMTRDRSLSGLTMPQIGVSQGQAVAGTALTLVPGQLIYDANCLSAGFAQALAARLCHIAAAITGGKDLAETGLLPEAERFELIERWNQSGHDHDRNVMVHTAFEAQVAATPDAIAIRFEGQAISYRALNQAANRAAHVLGEMGVAPGALVGLCTKRGFDLVIGALAILKAGAAYVPMDPSYPAERLQLFVEDSGCAVVVAQAETAALIPSGPAILALDREPKLAQAPDQNPSTGVTPADLAYLIYTSGSTGRPKGVMVEHRNVANFFQGMDAVLGREPGVWLAVTSLSFDISVLELFWTLARGFTLVIASDENRALVAGGPIAAVAPGQKRMDFSLYYWGNDDGQGAKKYQLLLDGAKFADEHGFAAIWTPERHFHAFGGPYPNPAVTGAAVAALTKNIAVRAGSCVVPLHHPARVAEEWAVIDNLTNGRAGIAIASGWQPEDFVLRPENTPPQNKPALYQAAEQIRSLWRGEAVAFAQANGEMLNVVTQPRPVSSELPLWVTTAGNPETWREAGRMGANVLTHLLGQSIAEVADKIKIYHQALREAGHAPDDFTVTLMLHSYIGASRAAVRAVVEAPMKAYLASAVGLVKQYAWAFPAFKKPQGASTAMDIDLRSLSDEENDAILDFAFQRYFDESGLFGTVEDALARVEALRAIGVGEVACLIDYGVAPDLVKQGFAPLAEVVARANPAQDPAEEDHSIAALIARHHVTHLQCTPSMARMIAMNDDSRAALARVKTMLVGGEALPGALVADLRAAGVARLLNMYGPTETTIWSSCEEVSAVEPISNIGKPLANQQLYVLSDAMQPQPIGIEGELWIGGEGVTRGYWQREDLTGERFLPNPYHPGRIYRTGDLVRRRADGKLDYISRVDHQVKLRGYRIELGEIEAQLEAQPGVKQAVVMAREDSPGDLRLVAYFTGSAPEADLRAALATVLPAHMLPQHFVSLQSFPLTPNRKVDRKALPKPLTEAPPATLPDAVAAAGAAASIASAADAGAEILSRLSAIWAQVLGLARVGPKDNFFALGGHSLLAVQAHRDIRAAFPQARVSITDIFRFPVLEALAAHIGAADAATSKGVLPLAPVQVSPYAPPMQMGQQAAPALDAGLAELIERRRAMRLKRRGLDA